LPVPAETVVARMADEGFLAGVPVGVEGGVVRDGGEALLVAVTERRTKDEIDAFVAALEKVVR
jgi:glycine cleavage system protein P-like pyridoxal-binding family